jgi:glycosyltransferase involved in cell wall biosynthesis
VDFFGTSFQCLHPAGLEPKSYYLYAGELRDYKRPDLAVEACLRMRRKLVVVGNGKMRETLRRRIGGRAEVVFFGRISDDELRSVFVNARALLFPGVEDFGIVPVEVQAAGTPVIALGKGGALETVRDGETGLFFKDPVAESLCEAIESFEAERWDSDACRKNASRFSQVEFRSRMKSVLA